MHLFAYGTLMEPQIMRQVAGCVLQGVATTLHDYVRYGVRGEQYPGVVERPGSRVDGIAYLDVPAAAVQRLDRFEGKMYSREAVEVHRRDDAAVLAAMVYVFKPEYRQLLTETPWDYNQFLHNGQVLFKRDYSGFAAISTKVEERG
ncbi:MAG: gamma-glutamylcyclotransferase family protein [Desulfopila sp.]